MQIDMKVVSCEEVYRDAMFPQHDDPGHRKNTSGYVYQVMLESKYGYGSVEMLGAGKLPLALVAPLPVGKWYTVTIEEKADGND